MKGVYVLTALVGLGMATWVSVLVINGARSWLRKREEKRLDAEAKRIARDEAFNRWFTRGSGPDRPDGL